MALEVMLMIIIQVGMGQSPTVPSHLSDEGKETSSSILTFFLFADISNVSYFESLCFPH